MKFPGKIRKTAACFLLFCIVLACIPVHAEENEAVEISAPSGVLMEPETKTILYEKDKDTRRSPASVTKVMTLLLIFDHLKDGSLKLTDTVTTSAHAKSMGGSQVFLEEGETQDVETMIKCIVVASGNDASVAMAEHIAGSEEAFVKEMNARAEGLGMENTHFVDCCGLTDSDEHYTTAYDIALMSRELITKYPKILEYSGIWMDTLRGGETQLTNTNKMLKSYAGITGLKTGTTNGAGVCISASAVRDGMGLLAVVLGSPSSKERFASATAMLDYGFATFEAGAFPQIAGRADTLRVTGGVEQQVALDYTVPEKMLLKKGEGQTLTAAVVLPEKLDAPVAAGRQVASVTLKAGEEILGEYPVTTRSEVPQMDWGTALSLLTKALFTL